MADIDLDRLNRPAESVEDAITREYPPATAAPCNDCPWRRNSAPGWLGPHDSRTWLEAVHGEAAIACHQTIPPGGGWGPETRQCRGAAIFRDNTCKEPMNPTMALGPRDTTAVFANSVEFLDHHGDGPDA